MTRETLAKLRMIEKQAEDAITKETGASVEVTIRDTFVVYTEDIALVETIKALLVQVRSFINLTNYEADEDGPAAAVLAFQL